MYPTVIRYSAAALLLLATAITASAQHKHTTSHTAAQHYSPKPAPAGPRRGSRAFDSDTRLIGLSAGFGIDYNYYGSASSLPAIALTYDQGLKLKGDFGPGTISLGGIVGVKTAHYNYGYDGYDARWTNYVVGLRGAYHITVAGNSNWDAYAGVMAGVRIFKYSDSYYDTFAGGDPYHYNSIYPALGIFVGTRYRFSSSFGVFGELGYDISFLRVGISASL